MSMTTESIQPPDAAHSFNFATSAESADAPQPVTKTFKTFSRLARKKGTRAYLLMNQHGNGDAGAANERSAVNLLAAAGLRVDAGSFQPGQGQGKKLARPLLHLLTTEPLCPYVRSWWKLT